MGQRIIVWLSAIATGIGLILALLALNSQLLGQLTSPVLLLALALALGGLIGLGHEMAFLLYRMRETLGLNRPRDGLLIRAERHGKWIVLSVANNASGNDFRAQILTIDGGKGATYPHLPRNLKWEGGSLAQHIAHGQTAFVCVAKIHDNGIAYINMGKWSLEPPLVLEETPTPAGGGMTYIGVYPPPDIPDTSKQVLERLQFDFTVRVSSDANSVDHTVRIAFWAPPQDVP